MGDARFDDHKYSVWDFRDADFSSITKDNAEMSAAISWAATKSVPEMKIAFIASNPHTIDIINHYIKRSLNHRSSWEFGVFISIKDAIEWGET